MPRKLNEMVRSWNRLQCNFRATQGATNMYNHCPTYCAAIYSYEAKSRLLALIGILPSVVGGREGEGKRDLYCDGSYMEGPVRRRSWNSALNYCQCHLLVYSACPLNKRDHSQSTHRIPIPCLWSIQTIPISPSCYLRPPSRLVRLLYDLSYSLYCAWYYTVILDLAFEYRLKQEENSALVHFLLPNPALQFLILFWTGSNL